MKYSNIMETKASKIRNLVANNKISEAIKMAASFTRDFSKSEQRVIQIAKETIGGHASFYNQLGIDTEAMVEEAKILVMNKYMA